MKTIDAIKELIAVHNLILNADAAYSSNSSSVQIIDLDDEDDLELVEDLDRINDKFYLEQDCGISIYIDESKVDDFDEDDLTYIYKEILYNISVECIYDVVNKQDSSDQMLFADYKLIQKAYARLYFNEDIS